MRNLEGDTLIRDALHKNLGLCMQRQMSQLACLRRDQDGVVEGV